MLQNTVINVSFVQKCIFYYLLFYLVFQLFIHFRTSGFFVSGASGVNISYSNVW